MAPVRKNLNEVRKCSLTRLAVIHISENSLNEKNFNHISLT